VKFPGLYVDTLLTQNFKEDADMVSNLSPMRANAMGVIGHNLGSKGASLLRLRFDTLNARQAAAVIGRQSLIHEEMSADAINEAMASEPRGFYSGVVNRGYSAINPILEGLHSNPNTVEGTLRQEFERMMKADKLFTGFGSTTVHEIGRGVQLSVNPGLGTIEQMASVYPEYAAVVERTKTLLAQNYLTPAGEPSPVVLAEDHPGWATEKPDIRNIRGNMAEAITDAKASADEITVLVDAKYGAGTMASCENVVVFGIGANDMYMKDLPMLVNNDPSGKRKIYVVFEPSQLDQLPESVKADNTLFISISRGGGTQETLKSMEWANLQGKMKYLVTYANKGAVKKFGEQLGGISLDLRGDIGGRYMWAKGKIVLVPLALSASDEAWEEYTGAMTDFDNKFWPVGSDTTLLDLASHMYLYGSAYNIPQLFACSNHPVLDAGLRQLFQLHNEAVGKLHNHMMAVGPGMEILPYAHAGADGTLGLAISAGTYGAFIFDAKYDPKSQPLTLADVLNDGSKDSDAAHVGLTKELLRMACVFPNQAKFTMSGAPNFMVTTDGVDFRTLATLTAFYQNLMYHYLIMNETNPDSNPNVDAVRKTTAGLVTSLLANSTEAPLGVISREIPKIMVGGK
jgi:glucose-6-phosphate isomerase